MLTDKQLRIVGLDKQPGEAAAYQIALLLDLSEGGVHRLMEAIARENLLAIGTRIGQSGADLGRLTCESYFWSRVPTVFVQMAQQIASMSAPEEDTRVDE